MRSSSASCASCSSTGRHARVHQFAEAEPDTGLDPGGGALAHFFAGRPVQEIRRQRLDLGRQDVAARQQARDRAAAPTDAQLRIEYQLAVGRVGESLQAHGQILAQRAQRSAQHSLLVGMSLGRVWHEAEPLDAAEMLSFDRHLARRSDRRRHFTLIAQSSYKQGRPSIDKPLRQTLVQYVRKLVFDRARPLLPMH